MGNSNCSNLKKMNSALLSKINSGIHYKENLENLLSECNNKNKLLTQHNLETLRRNGTVTVTKVSRRRRSRSRSRSRRQRQPKRS